MTDEEKKAMEDLKRLRKGIEILNQITPEKDETDIKAIDLILNLIEKQQKEIEEKTTILLAGAEKVKQLEKGNRSLMESRIKWKNRYYKEKEKNKENQVLIDDIKDHRIVYIDTPEFEEKFISKDKIREKINYYRKYCGYDGVTMIGNTQLKELEELLEENNNE